jgi:putative transposase
VRRTTVVKLAGSDEQRDALHRTADQYLYCANRIADYCWSDTSYTECKNNKREVRDALYRRSRPNASGLDPEAVHLLGELSSVLCDRT